MKNKWIVGYPILFAVYAVYSYTQVDPNLVLSSNNIYLSIQAWLWSMGHDQRLVSSLVFGLIVLSLFGVYWYIIKALKINSLTKGNIIFLAISSILILMFSYPALSHDIFNYVFNAKMVWFYNADPHVMTALDFSSDPWTQFMHNTHTTAPYGRGWTYLSLVPSYLGQNHLKLTMMLFRLMMVGFLGLLVWLQKRLTLKDMAFLVVVFLLNPLVLIETVGNIHNDVVMMSLLLASIYLWRKFDTKKDPFLILLGVITFLLSIWIKLASVMFLVGIVIYYIARLLNKRMSWGGSQTIAMFLPLLTQRSQRFLPWYLIWPLSFLPLTKEEIIRTTMLLFSLTGLLSYLPYLYFGEYNPIVLSYRMMILFSLPTVYLIYSIRFVLTKRNSKGGAERK